MSRVVIGVLGVSVGALVSSAQRPAVLRVRGVELVDADQRVVGRLIATERGAELVLGGEAQASLVTDGPTAALNLIGDDSLARILAGEGARLELRSERDVDVVFAGPEPVCGCP